MATKTRGEWLQELETATEAGNYDRAEKIATALGVEFERPGSDAVQVAPPSIGSNVMDTVRGLGQGVTFNWGDELGGAAAAGINSLLLSDEEKASLERSGVDYGYEGARDRERDRLEASRLSSPYLYGAGEFAGGAAVPGVGAFKGAQALTRGLDRLRPAGALALTGGAAGAVTGAGVSEEDTLGGVATDAAIGGGIGALAAPILGGVISKVGEWGGAVGMGLARRLATDPEMAANMRVRQSMEADNIWDARQAREMLDDSPGGALADVGANLREEAVLSAKQPGAGRTIGEDFVRGRQLGSAERLSGTASEGLKASRYGTWGDDYYKFMDDVKAGAKDQARPLYEEAYRELITPTPEMVRISKTDAFQEAAKRAMKNLRNKLDTFGGAETPAPNTGQVSTQLMDQILRELRDESNRAFRSGSNEYGADVYGIYKALRAQVMQQNPKLAQARGVWAGARQMEEAAEIGRNLLNGNKTYADDVERLMGDMGEGERDAFTIGVIRGIMDKIESAPETGDVGRRLFNSRRVQDTLKEAFQDEEAFTKFYNAARLESRFQNTANRVTGGSPTAQLLFGADQPRAMDETAVADTMGFLTRVLSRMVNETVEDASKLGPDDYENIAQLLFDPNITDDQLARIFSTGFRRHSVPTMEAAGGALGTGAALEIGRQVERID